MSKFFGKISIFFLALLVAFLLSGGLNNPANLLAQDASPVPTESPTPEPSATIAPLPTAEPSAEPSATPAPTPTPTSQPEVLTTPAPTPNVSPNPPPASPTPTPTVTTTSEQGQIAAFLYTDQADYSPTQTAIIFGSGFKANETYTLEITSDNLDVKVNVTSDSSGNFNYAYQLDGVYRPLYNVVAKDSSGTIIATTSFTDAPDPKPSVKISQCQNGGIGNPLEICAGSNWVTGAVIGSKAHWQEGNLLPYRAIVKDLFAGVNTVTLSFDTAKSSELKHAIDYIGSYDYTETTGAATATHANQTDPCGDVFSCDSINAKDESHPLGFVASSDIGVPAGLTSAYPTSCANGTFSGLVIAGAIKAWASGGTVSALSVAYVDSPPVNAGGTDCPAKFKITFTVSANHEDVILAWGGHVAANAEWGSGNAVPTGSPYHMHAGFAQESPVGTSFTVGNQDLALASSAIVVPTTLTINKVCDPSDDTGKFNLRIDGTTKTTDAACGGTTGAVTVTAATHTVSETAGTATNLSNYTSVIGGNCAADGSITLAAGDNKVCTITNTLKTGTLIVKKHVVSDNGGTTLAPAFSLHVKSGGNDVTNSPAAGSESGTSYTLNAGSYVVSEDTPPTGYTQTGFSDNCDSNGNVTVVAGQTKTCTINNDDIAPTLKLVKQVTNDNNGPANPVDWTLTATGTPSGFSDTGDSTTFHTVKAGVGYVLSESVVSGYDAGNWSCDGGSLNGSTITLSLDDDVICTITNNDQPAEIHGLKFEDHNGNGTKNDGDQGLSGWTVYLDLNTNGVLDQGEPSTQTGQDGSYAFTGLSAGSYKVREVGQDGWTQITTNPADVVLTNGQVVNDVNFGNFKLGKISGAKFSDLNGDGVWDQGEPALSGWTINLSGPVSGSTQTNEQGNYEFSGLTVGSYTVGETVQQGWTQTAPQGNTYGVSVSSGTDATQKVFGNFKKVNIKAFKFEDKNGNGQKDPEDSPISGWKITINGGDEQPTDADGMVEWIVSTGGNYTVAEEAQIGWTHTNSDSVQVSVQSGDQDKIVEFLNFKNPKLTVKKHVISDNGGEALASAFSLHVKKGEVDVDGSPADGSEAGTTYTLTPGTYGVSENTPVTGYEQTGISGECDQSGNVTLSSGDVKSCTITNDDIPAHLIVIKHVITDNGGSAVAGDFNMSIAGVTATGGNSFSGDEAGTDKTLTTVGSYSVTESGPAGYSESDSADCKGTIALGETKTCTITNDDIAPQIKVVKHVIKDNGGTAVAGDFTMNVAATNPSPASFSGDENGTLVTLDAGSYSVSETGPAGYLESDSADCKGSIAVGDSLKTCTITNDDIQPILTVNKIVNNNHGGTLGSANFPLFVGAAPVTNGTPTGFNVGAYLVSETGQNGYTQTSIVCDGIPTNAVTLAVGDVKSCTITNDDQPAHLTVNKVLIGPRFLPKDPGTFNLLVNEATEAAGIVDTQEPRTSFSDPVDEGVDGGTQSLEVNAGEHSVSEQGANGTDLSKYNRDMTCVDEGGNPVTATPTGPGDFFGPTPNPWSITLVNGDNVTCTIKNSPLGRAVGIGTLAVIKHTVGGDDTFNYSGTVEHPGTIVSGGSFDINGVTTTNGTSGFTILGREISFDSTSIQAFPDFPADVTLTEAGSTEGWVFNGVSCTSKKGSTFNYDNAPTVGITFQDEDSVTCTYTNTKLPKLTVTKVVNNNYGGTLGVSDFPLFVDQGSVTSGVKNTSTIGGHVVSETGDAGYTETIGGDCDAQGNVTLAAGDDKTCTITNNDKPAQLIVIKHVINDSGDVAAASDFTMHLTGGNLSNNDFPGSESGVTVTLNAGSYSADEVANNGYVKTLGANCSGTIANGETKTCTITNNDTPHATRTQGFWQTHTNYTTAVFGSNSWTIGTHTINNTNRLFAAFYASISKKSTRANRAALDQARMQMLQQWVAAKLNCQAFTCSTATQTLLTNAAAAWNTGTAAQILSYASQLDTYNNSNDAITISGQGKATPKDSQSSAASQISYWDNLP